MLETMSTTWLISGPPGCGTTTWILNTLRDHPGPCRYLRLRGTSQEGLEQGSVVGIGHRLDFMTAGDPCVTPRRT